MRYRLKKGNRFLYMKNEVTDAFNICSAIRPKVPNGPTGQVLEGRPFGQSGLMPVTGLDQIK